VKLLQVSSFKLVISFLFKRFFYVVYVYNLFNVFLQFNFPKLHFSLRQFHYSDCIRQKQHRVIIGNYYSTYFYNIINLINLWCRCRIIFIFILVDWPADNVEQWRSLALERIGIAYRLRCEHSNADKYECLQRKNCDQFKSPEEDKFLLYKSNTPKIHLFIKNPSKWASLYVWWLTNACKF
jgi:hypothetical protein